MERVNIQQVWDEFSKQKNIQLKSKDRTQAGTTQTHFLVNYTNEIATISFIGMLSETHKEKSFGTTTILLEFNEWLNMKDFELTREKSFIKSLTWVTKSAFDKQLLTVLKLINGTSISLKDNIVRLDIKHIFKSKGEFAKIEELVEYINANNTSA